VRSGGADVRKHFSLQLPTHAFNQLHYKLFPFFNSWWQPSGLKERRVAEKMQILCQHPHPVATGSPTEYTFLTTPANPTLQQTLQHQNFMQVQL